MQGCQGQQKAAAVQNAAPSSSSDHFEAYILLGGDAYNVHFPVWVGTYFAAGTCQSEKCLPAIKKVLKILVAAPRGSRQGRHMCQIAHSPPRNVVPQTLACHTILVPMHVDHSKNCDRLSIPLTRPCRLTVHRMQACFAPTLVRVTRNGLRQELWHYRSPDLGKPIHWIEPPFCGNVKYDCILMMLSGSQIAPGKQLHAEVSMAQDELA